MSTSDRLDSTRPRLVGHPGPSAGPVVLGAPGRIRTCDARFRNALQRGFGAVVRFLEVGADRENVNGTLEKTGRWVVLQTVIEWGDGMADRGWMVTTYPVSTQSGNPPKNPTTGKTYCPAWLANSVVMGPVNNDILY